MLVFAKIPSFSTEVFKSMIPAIGANNITSNSIKINNLKNNNNRVSFGFGEDYYNEDFLEANDYVHKRGNGNIFQYLKLVGFFFIAVIKENFTTQNSVYNDAAYNCDDTETDVYDENDTDDDVLCA